MATRTISLTLEAYDHLRAARRHPTESFSRVVMRAHWLEETVTGGELLRRYREYGPHLSEEVLDGLEEMKAERS